MRHGRVWSTLPVKQHTPNGVSAEKNGRLRSVAELGIACLLRKVVRLFNALVKRNFYSMFNSYLSLIALVLGQRKPRYRAEGATVSLFFVTKDLSPPGLRAADVIARTIIGRAYLSECARYRLLEKTKMLPN